MENLYRIKAFDRWHYGYPMSDTSNNLVAFNGDKKINGYEFFDLLADAETLGRYSGITDKHGTKVFVGDILKDADGKLYLVVEEETRIVVKKQDKRVATWKYTHKKEIVGNIHDNPDLWRWTNEK